MQLVDAHPEYLTDVYAAAKAHPRTLDAMLTLATADMKDPAMAKMVAAQVAIHPEVVGRLVLDAVDVAKKSPRARAAIDKALGERADAAAELLADDSPAMAALIKAVLKVIETRPQAREAVMRAMRDGSPELLKMAVKEVASGTAK